MTILKETKKSTKQRGGRPVPLVQHLRSRARAETYSAVSVVNALSTGRGSTVAIDLKCVSEMRIEHTSNDRSRGRVAISSGNRDVNGLIPKCIDYGFKFLNKIRSGLLEDYGHYSISVRIASEIPPACGLKSSSAVSTAVVNSLFRLFIDDPDPKDVLDVSCRASKDSGASITGAYDDAAACLLGGLVLTDNSKFRILKHANVPESIGNTVLLLIPPRAKRKFTSSIDRSAYTHFRRESGDAFQYALKGDLPQAMFLNSMVQSLALRYSLRPVLDAILEGATAAGISGKGPAIFAFCRDKKSAGRIGRAWMEDKLDTGMRTIETRVVQPKR